MMTIVGTLFLFGFLYCLFETDIGCLGSIIAGILAVITPILLFIWFLDSL